LWRSQLRRGFSCTCARIPTRSSSTLWSSPLDVSMNLQPQLLASLRPAARQTLQYQVGSKSNTSDFCSGGTRFKSWLGQQLSWLKSSWHIPYLRFLALSLNLTVHYLL
jgi:hypothetical protein